MQHQQSRIEKALNERIFLLDCINNNEYNGHTVTFTICGSTRHIYQVKLRETGTISCDCPDMKIHCKKQACVCKHVCFVIMKVLRLSQNSVSTICSTEVFTTAFNFCETGSKHDLSITNDSIINAYRKVQKGTTLFDINEDSRMSDAECPICFDAIAESDSAACKSCPDCKNVVHKVCIEKWMQFGKINCVYCRSTTWSTYASQKTNSYMKI